MNNEYRVYGPPGTGKTTKIKQMIQKAIKNVGRENIMAASFSKGAAMELKGRDLQLDKNQIATLHSVCYRLLGNPVMAEENIELWNMKYPVLEIIRKKLDFDDEKQQIYHTDGERLLAQLNLLRAGLVKECEYQYDVLDFHKKWSAFKKEHYLFDFCDLIEITYKRNIYPEYSVGFFDEAQDFTPLELALVRNWGKKMKYYVLAGDDDQCIYGFKGCNPEGFIGGDIPNKNITILEQSYRMPIAVQRYANNFIKTVKNRVNKEYKPKNTEGKVVHSNLRYLDKTEIINDMQKYIKQDKTLMFLASCSYMLHEIISELKLNALPFHNPYRKQRCDWNPLNVSKGTERLLTFLKPEWTKNDVYNWAEVLRSKEAILHGAKKLIKAFKDDDEPFQTMKLNWYFTNQAIEEITNRNVKWYYNNTLPERQKSIKYPIDIYLKYGKDKLEQKPKIIIGTIHSVKGGESDVVYLFPDISQSSARELTTSADKQDSLTRLFYVGMTRTKETLVLCEPSTKYYIKI